MLRWPIIRHARWLYWSIRFDLWWQEQGRHMGLAPNPADEEHLNRIWRGEA